LLGMFKIIGGDQRPYGPVSADQLRQWVAEGRADGQTLVQAEGSADWKPLASFPEFAGLVATPPTVASAPSAAAWTPSAPRPDIPTYLPHAIFVTLCCCLPLGVPAIVYASQVSSKLARGDVDGAKAASAKARMWFWIALAVGAVATTVQLIMFAGSMSKMPVLR
jgi:hypothetical protein